MFVHSHLTVTVSRMLRNFNRKSSISGQSTVFNLDISLLWTARLFKAYKVHTEFSRTLVSFGNGPHFAEACDGNDLLCTKANGICEHSQAKGRTFEKTERKN